MKATYFRDCHSLDEVKKEYKRLALVHHPDKGGDTAIMQEINRQYEEMMLHPSFAEAKAEAQEDFIKFPEIISQIIGFDITIEVCGNWIWLTGNTYAYRKELRESGFFFAPKKSMWYWRPKDFKSANSKPKDMDYIRSKYGSDVVASRQERVLDEKEEGL